MSSRFPKAYLRVDPNIDQTHPDNLGDFMRLLCAANRQQERGRFKSRAVLINLFGKTATGRLFARGDVVEANGCVEVPGWDIWQEGDLDVGTRVRMFRERHGVTSRYTPVTPPLPERYPAVTPTVTEVLPTSEASGVRRIDVPSLGSPTVAIPAQTARQPDVEATSSTTKVNGKVGSWTPSGEIAANLLGALEEGPDAFHYALSKRDLEEWTTFGREWDDFKTAWIGRGFHHPPAGSDEDDPEADSPSQRALLWSVLDARPHDLASWVRMAKGRTVNQVIASVLEQWHNVRDEAEQRAEDDEFRASEQSKAERAAMSGWTLKPMPSTVSETIGLPEPTS